MPNLWAHESDDEIRVVLEDAHPSLHLTANKRIIRGAFNVVQANTFLGGFQIEIHLDENDVLGLPTLWEVGGRIPRVPDRHINTSDGSACLYLPEDLLVRTKRPLGIASFLNGPVKSFFIGQLHVESGGSFPYGEWNHGSKGVAEMLCTLFRLDDVKMCLAFLELLSRKVIKAHWPCACGSRRPLRDCHYRLMQNLRHRLPLLTRRFLFKSARRQIATLKEDS